MVMEGYVGKHNFSNILFYESYMVQMVLPYTERLIDWIKRLRFVFLRLVKGITAHIEIYFSSVPDNCLIQKPIENEEPMKGINENIVDDTTIWNSK